jgi:hypothetical protein
MECCATEDSEAAPKGHKDSAQGFNPGFPHQRRSALKAAVEGVDFAHGLEDKKM